jgi:hypothetical protein
MTLHHALNVAGSLRIGSEGRPNNKSWKATPAARNLSYRHPAIDALLREYRCGV